MQKKILYLLISTMGTLSCDIAAQKGVVIVPIADLIGQPLPSFASFKHKKQPYDHLPFDHYKAPTTCPRIHQLLFNEVVDIIDTRNSELLVEIPQLFYVTQAQPHKKQNRYWLRKDAVAPFSTLVRKKIDLTVLPEPINFKKNSLAHPQKNIATLTLPFYEKTTGLTFSAGTRFIYLPRKTTKKYISVRLLHPRTYKISIVRIPRDRCILSQRKQPAQHQRDFVHLLKRWAHVKDGLIPYVWGGCSFTTTLKKNIFSETKIDTRGIVFDRNNYPHATKGGLDCAGLVSRTAHICGIPLYGKNTTTIVRCLEPLGKRDCLVEGDIIWHNGHVLVISDLQKNLAIEARGYAHGYGRIQEIALNKIFKGINSYQQLRKAYESNTILLRKHKNGKTVQRVAGIKILKLASAWKT